LLTWDTADLETRLCRALDVAKVTVSTFAIDGYGDKESPAFNFGPEKPVAEAAMLIYAASASAQCPTIHRHIDDLAQLLIPHARSERVLIDIALHPTLAFKLAVPHILLTKLGYADIRFDDLLRSCMARSVRNGHDRPPSSSVERRWISRLWNHQECDRESRRNEFPDSMLSRPIDVLGGLREDAYAFTHLLMYQTDFGYRKHRLPRRRSILLNEAQSLLARFIDAEDYDLAGEILLAWPLTGAPWSPAAAFGFRILASVEDQAGMLPCGNISLTRLRQLKGEEGVRYALGTAYHTALVMGFLCAASLRPGRLPPKRYLGHRFEQSFLVRLLNCIDHDQGHWQGEYFSLAADDQERLAPMILDIALVQKCRKHDYEAAGSILSLADEYRVAISPLSRQVADLMERIAICSHALLPAHSVSKDSHSAPVRYSSGELSAGRV
jgi:hypothetical protein